MIVKSVVNSQNSAWAAILPVWISILFVSLSVAAQDDSPSQPQPPPPQQEAREKEFSFLMSQATLIGRYTSEPFETEEKKKPFLRSKFRNNQSGMNLESFEKLAVISGSSILASHTATTTSDCRFLCGCYGQETRQSSRSMQRRCPAWEHSRPE